MTPSSEDGACISSGTPRDFLELYPHPAFVLAVPTLDAGQQLGDPGLDVVWGNDAWRLAAGPRSLLECVAPRSVHTFIAWVCAPEISPLTVSFMFGGRAGRYHLAQTRMPSADSRRCIVVTSIPSEPSAALQVTSGPPELINLLISTENKREAEEKNAAQWQPFEPPVRPPGEEPGTPVVDPDLPPGLKPGETVRIGADGKIRMPPPSKPNLGVSASGRPCDVKKLLEETIDWAATPLGPMCRWSRTMQTFVGAMMASSNNSAMWYGREFTLMYNQHFANTMAWDHPDSFGSYGPAAWARLADTLGPWTELLLNGQTLHIQQRFVTHRSKADGKLREMYTNQYWVPCREPDGSFLGIFYSCLDATTMVVSKRRAEILRRLTEYASTGRTMDDFDHGVLKILEDNPKDAPFGILYHVERPRATSRPTTPRLDGALDARVELRCAGSVGVPFQHRSCPDSVTVTLKGKRETSASKVPTPLELDVGVQQEGGLQRRNASPQRPPIARENRTITSLLEYNGHRWPFAEALNTHRPVLVRDCSKLVQGYPVRVWDELPTSAVVIPITRDSDDGIPSAVLVLGLSTRLDFDREYEGFVDMLRIQMASFLVAVRSYLQDQELIQQLAQVDRAKNLLFSNVANDLIAPISMVSGPLDDLVDDLAANPGGSNLLNIARRNVRSLRAIVRMLVEVSTHAQGPGVLSFTRVNLGALTRDMASMFRKSIEKHGVEYTIDCDLTPQEVYVDREAWEKIVVTTIGMSAKYTRKGYISVSLHYANRQAVIQFRNTSTGLPKRLVEHIGELEYETERDEMPAGAVVHFALLKKLVDLHGGTLDVESTAITDSEQSGVHVTIYLPLGFKHLPPEDLHLERETPRHDLHLWEDWEDTSLETPSVIEQRSWGVDPATLFFEPTDVILLVDENADSIRYMRAIFEPFCTVLEAHTAKAAVELCAAAPPDLIIADLTLPYQNGEFLLANLRAGSRDMQLTPLILLTPHDDARPDHALAADDYLSRPFNARELLSRGHMQLQLGKRRRDLEARFEERTAELQALMDESPMGIIRIAPTGELTYANSEWYKQSGYPVDGDLSDWPNYLDDSCRDELMSGWEEFQNDPTRLTNHVTGRWTNGNWVTVKVVKMFKTEGGPLVGYIGSCMDVSEHKLNDQLQTERIILAEQRRREAEEAKAQQELLIDITSHEIRNPISSLMQCSSLVKTNLVGLQEDLEVAVRTGTAYKPTAQLLHTIQEDLDALDSIYECALTQERISNDVLSLGKLQLDLLQMFDVETNIREEIRKVVSVFQNEARMNRVQMSLRFGEGFDALGVSTVKIDPVRFCQIVTNLLANAIRFVTASEERRIDVKVDIGSVPPQADTCTKPPECGPSAPLGTETPLYLYTEVADTGPGLKPSEFETLFQRFTQASPKTHTVFGGSGLGLFVCRKITELMGGRIEVASEYARGSVFRFFVETRAGTTVTPRPRAYVPAPMSKDARRRILIVEDNVINRTVLQRQLKHVGFVPESVGNGLEAVERLRSLPPSPTETEGYDCVLMDLEMPVMDGYTATRMLRDDEAAGRPTNAIIALTGNARQAQLDDKMADFDDVVVKPYRLDDLLATIEGAIKRRTGETSKVNGWHKEDRGRARSEPVM